MRRFAVLLSFPLLAAATASAQPALVEAPLSETFGTFEGAGFAPAPVAGQLDSDVWIVSGVAAGDLAYGDTGDAGAYARGAAAGAVGEAGVWAFEVQSGDRALGAHPSMGELSPGAFETRFTNGTGAALESFTLSYECWQWNDGSRAIDVSVEIVAGGAGEVIGELACTGLTTADAAPTWTAETFGTVYTPADPIPADGMVRVIFHLATRGGGMGYDQVAIDDVTFGGAGDCGNGVVEPADACDDGNPCTMDTCVEPDGCSFDPIDMCAFDGGPADEDAGSAPPRDARVPARYDANMPPNELEPPDLGASDGPESDGCDCRVDGSPGAAAWPLLVALFWVRRRR